ncbi:hypothetical protein GCM10028819_32330 [Spirosoma humi]
MSNDRLIISNILDQQIRDIGSDMTEAKFFEFYCALQILKDYDLSYDEIISGVIGSGNDGGIDSLHIFLNGELIQEDTVVESLSKRKKNSIIVNLIQAKKANGFKEEVINKFISSTDELFNLSIPLERLSPVYSNELITLIGKFREVYKAVITTYPDISFNISYASLGEEIHPNTHRKVDRLREVIINHFDNAKFKFDFIGARELLQIARREPTSNFELEFVENPISTENGSYVCLVPIKSYYNFFVDENSIIIKRIFDSNVRDYQGNVKVNKAIQETLQNPGNEDFWFLNNGVTIVCPKASATGKRLLIEDPQIVNGLQTSYEIYSYFRNLKFDNNDQRRVLVRVIVEQDAGSRDNIVRATNSQTSIPETSLRAADKVQRDIEDFLLHNDFYYERRKNYYKNNGKPVSRIISISYMSQAVISILLQKPDYARARPSTLINQDQEYTTIFNERYPVQLYLSCINIMRFIEETLKSFVDDILLSRKDINNIKFHVAMVTVMHQAKNTENVKVEDILLIDTSQLDRNEIQQHLFKVLHIYMDLGGTDQVSKGPIFTQTLLYTYRKPLYTKK